ncbi:MAG: amidase family protein [Acidimicrobiales bacterium]
MTDPHPDSAMIAYRGAAELLDDLASGAQTSSAVVAALLERMAALDDPNSPVALRSIAAIAADAGSVARERDDERAGGRLRGPLHGVPVLIKDNVEALGLPATAGSTALIGRVARDAPLVARLRDAGAIVIASTNLSQWANLRSPRSSSGWSATGGLVANPWALDRSAGGSSSGSGAAVAAGLAPLAVGTETDGSIVCPASVNGLVGLKPTVGQVPTAHVVPISASQDSPGPIARSVADAALLYSVLAARPVAASREPLRVAVATNWRTGHPLTDAHVERVVSWLEESGVSVVRREAAEPSTAEHDDELAVLLAELADDLSAYLADRPGEGVHSLSDVVAYEDAHADVEQPFFGHEFFVQALASGGRAGSAYAEARRRNLAWAVETCLTPALEGVDVLVAPAYGPSWKSDLVVGGHPGPASVATMAPAIAGWPILSVPAGLVQDLPVGLAVIARPDGEGALLDVARRVEALVATNAPLPRPFWCDARRG